MENILCEAIGAILVIYATYKLSIFAFYRKIDATCIAVSCKWSYADGEASLGYGGTFKYDFDKREIISKDKIFLDSSKLEVGHKYVLYVNPKNPRVFVKKTELKYYVFFLLTGLAFAFLSPVVF